MPHRVLIWRHSTHTWKQKMLKIKHLRKHSRILRWRTTETFFEGFSAASACQGLKIQHPGNEYQRMKNVVLSIWTGWGQLFHTWFELSFWRHFAMGRLQPFTGPKHEGVWNPKRSFTLYSIHEKTSVDETEADSRSCWRGLGMLGDRS